MIDEIFPFYSSKFIIHLEYETPSRYFFFHLSTGKKKKEMKKLPKYIFVFLMYGKFWSVSLEHSIKHKCFILESAGAIRSQILMRIIFKVVLKKNSLCYKMCAHSWNNNISPCVFKFVINLLILVLSTALYLFKITNKSILMLKIFLLSQIWKFCSWWQW